MNPFPGDISQNLWDDLRKSKKYEIIPELIDLSALSEDNQDMMILLFEALKRENEIPLKIKPLLKEQLTMLSISKHHYRWSIEILNWAIMMKKTGGSQCYNYVNKYLILPSGKTIYNYSHTFVATPGWNEEYLKNLFSKEKGKTLRGFIAFVRFK
jgi:hypothetical protein